jgi:hypothetical protein
MGREPIIPTNEDDADLIPKTTRFNRTRWKQLKEHAKRTKYSVGQLIRRYVSRGLDHDLGQGK